METDNPIKIAILDLYDRQQNEGMRGIRTLLYLESKKIETPIRWHIYDVRYAEEVPDLSYDIYISSGGPGSPLSSEGTLWEKKYFNLIDDLWEYNQQHDRKKYAFFICHSFQLICRHWKLGLVSKRHSPAFGIFPTCKTEDGKKDWLFESLPDPFFATDSRDYQVTQPNLNLFEKENFKILAIEKERPHVPLERALMAIRFSEEFVGTQFHPEADPHGMLRYFQRPDKKEAIIHHYGYNRYYKMIDMLNDPEKLERTRLSVLPAFLHHAFQTTF